MEMEAFSPLPASRYRPANNFIKFILVARGEMNDKLLTESMSIDGQTQAIKILLRSL